MGMYTILNIPDNEGTTLICMEFPYI